MGRAQGRSCEFIRTLKGAPQRLVWAGTACANEFAHAKRRTGNASVDQLADAIQLRERG